MKIILILFICAAVASSEILRPNDWCSGHFLGNSLRRCGAIYGATIDDYLDYRYLKPARNGHMKCFRACQFTECKAYNTDGSFVANAVQTTAFAFTRKNPNLWNHVTEVSKFCIKSLPAISFEQPHKKYNICDKTEDYIQCLSANLPEGSSYEGLF
ncbi:uncharacterized protein LOC142230540 [Haematobia irritans]|uniref:uncharacterized protein LOC142230540 n=1 Tax=Haematobia irritans TaxID=7368 RepID=UPI003F4FF74B